MLQRVCTRYNAKLPSAFERKGRNGPVGSLGPEMTSGPNKTHSAHDLKNAHKHTYGHQNDDNPLQIGGVGILSMIPHKLQHVAQHLW